MAQSSAGAGSVRQGAGLSNEFKLTFNIETLRMIAYAALMAMVGVGFVVTRLFVTVDEHETVIFKTFGFNHLCNVFDHQPSRTISGLLVLTFIVPMVGFVVCAYYRTYDAVKEGRLPAWVHSYSKTITPFAFLAVCYTYMWFVNGPGDQYGFLAHYLPYWALQIALGLLAIHEVAYLAYSGNLPFGVSVAVAKGYLVILILTTVACHAAVFTLLAGFPILDSVHNPTSAKIFERLMYFYAFLAIAMPFFLAARNRKNGQISTITFA